MSEQMDQIVNMIDSQKPIEEEEENASEEAQQEASPEGLQKETSGVQEEAEEQAGIETITELAKELDIDPTELYELKVPMPGGVDSKTIGEIKDEYTDFVNQKRQFDSKIQDYEKQIQSGIQPLQGQVSPELAAQMEQTKNDITAIEQSYQQIDWTKFEQEDPGNAALQKQKFQEAYNTATGKSEQLQQQVQASQQENLGRVLQQEQVKLLKLVPEWSDRTVAQKEATEVQNLLGEYGFLPGEIDQVIDARQLKLIVDLVRLKSGLKNAAPSKVKEKSKTLRSGSLQLRNKAKDKEVADMFKKAKASRDPRIQAKAISQLLSGE